MPIYALKMYLSVHDYLQRMAKLLIENKDLTTCRDIQGQCALILVTYHHSASGAIIPACIVDMVAVAVTLCAIMPNTKCCAVSDIACRTKVRCSSSALGTFEKPTARVFLELVSLALPLVKRRSSVQIFSPISTPLATVFRGPC